MAVDKLVDSTQLDADLTSVANAIRTKGGTSASLAFPADFVSAIAAIPSGGGTTGTLTFDFTKGLTDEETGAVTWALSGATQDSNGLHLTGASHNAKLDGITLANHVVEIEVGSMTADFSSGNHGRFIMCDDSCGLIYRNSGYWQIYGSAWSAGTESNSTYFANSTVRIEYPSSGGNVKIYKDGTIMFNGVYFGINTLRNLRFGSTSTAYYSVTILKCTIYTAEAYALKLLLGS